jgi:PTH1 family peptidyl-tRNA hydrolase
MSLFGRRGAAAERRGTPADLLVVGLGNPGHEYEHSRHNVGADTVALLAERHGGTLKRSRERALVAEVTMGDRRVTLAFPQTYVNLSGDAVARLIRRYGITDPERVVVVHDELDLGLGRVKIKEGGGLAGHNGLRSIKAHLHTDAFLRVRIGVGKPPSKEQGADHVLRRVSKRERVELDIAVQEAADAVEAILQDGVDAAMNRFNTRNTTA